ncbi:MAG: redoxin domain-containing protein [Pseudomonadales bacterium]
MKQFVQLQEHLAEFEAAGLSVVALTYDTPELQQKFFEANAITYPFLSDIDARSVKALDILNTEHQPGDGAYGVPHPGVYVLDPDLRIVGKIFVQAYETRVDAPGVLAYARSVLNL